MHAIFAARAGPCRDIELPGVKLAQLYQLAVRMNEIKGDILKVYPAAADFTSLLHRPGWQTPANC
jgi:hypothetical protein